MHLIVNATPQEDVKAPQIEAVPLRNLFGEDDEGSQVRRSFWAGQAVETIIALVDGGSFEAIDSLLTSMLHLAVEYTDEGRLREQWAVAAANLSIWIAQNDGAMAQAFLDQVREHALSFAEDANVMRIIDECEKAVSAASELKHRA